MNNVIQVKINGQELNSSFVCLLEKIHRRISECVTVRPHNFGRCPNATICILQALFHKKLIIYGGSLASLAPACHAPHYRALTTPQLIICVKCVAHIHTHSHASCRVCLEQEHKQSSGFPRQQVHKVNTRAFKI